MQGIKKRRGRRRRKSAQLLILARSKDIRIKKLATLKKLYNYSKEASAKP